jgi:uncharacterized protein YcnI
MIMRSLPIALTLVLACAAAADAHVRVSPTSVAAESTATLTFRCPNERTSTPTVKLTIQLPEDVPLASVTVPPVAGWHSSVTMRALAAPLHTAHGDITSVVDTITWEGGSIAPGAAGLFPIVAGPIPAGHPLIFRAVQTYGSGEVVRWIQARAAGEPEPPFPAPVVEVR